MKCGIHKILCLQIPVAIGVSAYQAVALYKGRRVIASKGDAGTNWRVHQLLFYCLCGMVAGIVGGLLGLGGGFILGPLFLELGVPPQVHSCCFKIIKLTNKKTPENVILYRKLLMS